MYENRNKKGVRQKLESVRLGPINSFDIDSLVDHLPQRTKLSKSFN